MAMAKTLRKVDTHDQWVLDENGRVVGVQVAGQQALPLNMLACVLSPTGSILWTASQFAAITPKAGLLYMVGA
jgi:hypothetical protein